MKRPIKFRAWDAERNEFNYKILVGNTEDDNSDLYTAHCILIDGKWVNFDEHDDIVIEQFTGMQDVNGVDIYEGDKTDFGVVIWHGEELSFCIESDNNMVALSSVRTVNVIGNIHEANNET